jgi:hypothetical protein
MEPIVAALISGVLSGIIVAILNYFLTKKKTEAEVRKFEAETEKVRLEIQQIGLEFTKSAENVAATVNYQLAKTAEQIIYSSKQRQPGHDFSGAGNQIWTRVGDKHEPVTPKGEGTLSFEEGGIINLQRTNTKGRFEIWLQSYTYGGREDRLIIPNNTISGLRSLRVSCEAKVLGAEHTLKFVLKNEKTNKWLASEERRITLDTWTLIEIYFRVSPSEECRLRIDDQDVSQAPSSIQLRNIEMAERAT